MSTLKLHDSLLAQTDAAAVVLREELVPVEGPEGVLFPPTYAPGDGFPGGYNIDGDPAGKNVCLVDSVGSQANRIEPLFGGPGLEGLVPQVCIVAGDRRVSLLDAGHRAGDAIVRCSPLQEELRVAFQALLRGDAEPLAKIAPTSLVFGVWDSRDTQAKAPRLVTSTVRAYDVRKLTRSAQYNPALDYVGQGLLEDPTDKATKQGYAERGFVHVPATATHGGVIASGGVRREATLSLAALRMLKSAKGPERTLALQRYVLGLALVAITADVSTYLRQGCNLVRRDESARTLTKVYANGKREPFALDHATAVAFARAAAKEFGVEKNREVPFDKARAVLDLAGDAGKANGKKDVENGKKKAKGDKVKG